MRSYEPRIVSRPRREGGRSVEKHRGAFPSRPSTCGLAGGRMASWRTRGVGTPTSGCASRRRVSPAAALSRRRRRVPSVPRRDVARESRPDNREDGAARPVRLQELRQRGGGGGGCDERRGCRRLQGGRRRQDHAQCRASHR